MKGADERLAQDGLVVFQCGVSDHVEQLGHQRVPQLEQRLFRRVRTGLAEGVRLVVEGGGGLEEGRRSEGLHREHP